MNGINLVQDTITTNELHDLAEWIKGNPRLTKGPLTKQFENEWSSWQGVDSSIFVNSGSSANLLMAAALKYGKKLRNNVIVAPAVSWGTTVAPFMQLGFDVELCDCELDTLGVDPVNLEKLFVEKKPSAMIIVHVLGVPNKMKEITDLCKKYDVILLEDCCEAHGAEYTGKKVGTFGEMSTFSYYYGHHMSTIEGGMVSFNSSEYFELCLMLRSHGWVRDLSEQRQNEIVAEHSIRDFDAMYFFLHPGFNIRSTDLNAFLGLSQLKSLNQKVNTRNAIWNRYAEKLENIVSYQRPEKSMFVSPLAFGIISESRREIVSALTEKNIECRPLICGSIHRHPFWKKGGKYPNAEKVHDNGLYVPVHHNMNLSHVDIVADTICSAMRLKHHNNF